jgi:hypothetical protein
VVFGAVETFVALVVFGRISHSGGTIAVEQLGAFCDRPRGDKSLLQRISNHAPAVQTAVEKLYTSDTQNSLFLTI